jgi:hypothetical protein
MRYEQAQMTSSTDNQITIVVPPGKLSKEDVERIRGERTATGLTHLLNATKPRADPVQWFALGLNELEMMLEAWRTGGQHPFFTAWKQRAAQIASRPSPNTYARQARRLVFMACVALERAGFNKRDARHFVSRMLAHSHLFTDPPSAKALEHWAADEPRLKPFEEQQLACVIMAYGLHRPEALANYFIGLAQLAHNPRVEAFRELQPSGHPETLPSYWALGCANKKECGPRRNQESAQCSS